MRTGKHVKSSLLYITLALLLVWLFQDLVIKPLAVQQTRVAHHNGGQHW